MTVTTTVQEAVWGVGESLFEYWMTTLYMPAAVVFATLRVAVAVPPTPPAATKLSKVMPATGALVIAALATVPSGSLALTPVEAGVP